jgi:hypothetical protein
LHIPAIDALHVAFGERWLGWMSANGTMGEFAAAHQAFRYRRIS